MSNKKRSNSRPASRKAKPQQPGGAGSLVLPILVGLLVVAFIAFAIVMSEKRQGTTTTGAIQNTLSVPVVTAQPNPTVSIPFPGIERISVKQTKEQMDKGTAVLIDVRSQAAYDQSHAAGALSFPEETILEQYTQLPKDKLLVLYCT
jgi:hypothetical protein